MAAETGNRSAPKRERRMGRPSIEQAEEIDRRILETATSLYLREGFTVTMKAIVQATGLSSKTVYARYPNKDALFLGVLRHLMQAAKPAMELPAGEDEGIRDTLRQFILHSLRRTFQAESIALNRLISAEPHFRTQLDMEILGALDRTFLTPLKIYLEHQRTVGRIRPVDPHQTAGALTALILIEPAFHYNRNLPSPSDEEISQRADFIADLFFHGLAPD